MSKTLIKYKRNLQKVYERASGNRKEGDYLSALSSLLHEAEKNTKNYEVCSKIAQIYTDLGLYENAVIFWFKFMIRANKKSWYEGYNGLGANYYFIGDKSMAGHYFSKQVQSEKDFCLTTYEDVFEEYLEEEFSKKPKLTLIKEKTQVEIDEERLERARICFKEKNYEKAISELDLITSESVKYGEALYEKAYAYLNLDEIELAEQNAVKCIEEGYETAGSLTFIIHIYLSTANKNAEKYIARLINLPCADDEDKYKKLNALCEFSLFEEAEAICEELLQNDSFDVNTSFVSAFLLYNKGEYAKAVKCFKKAYLLSFSPVALYFLKIAQSANDGNPLRKNLKISFDLPQDVVEKVVDTIGKFYIEKDELSKYTVDEVLEVADWCFASRQPSIQALLILIFAKSKKAEYINYLKEMLINPSISDEIKSSCVSKLYEYAGVKKLYAVFRNYFKEINARQIEFKEPSAEIFKRAYCLAIGKLAIFEKDNFHKFEIGAVELQNELIASGKIDLVTDIPALACAMYFYSGKRDLPSDFIYYIFNVEKENVVQIIKYTEDYND